MASFESAVVVFGWLDPLVGHFGLSADFGLSAMDLMPDFGHSDWPTVETG